MTRLIDTTQRALMHRRERLVMENKEHFHRGEMTEYMKNCARIKRIAEEIQRRENEELRPRWEAYV